MWLHGFSNQGWLKRKFSSLAMMVEVRLIRLLGLKGWISVSDFKDQLLFKVDSAMKESGGRVLLVNIGPANNRYRAMLPGIDEQITRFNKVIEQAADAGGAEVLDVHAMVLAGGLEELQPDGCHLSAEGHRKLCQMILDTLK